MIIRYSMIDAYLACHNKFRLQYLDDKAERQESSALSFGSALHLAIKTYFEGEDPYDTFDMYWNSVKAKHLEYDRFSWEDLGEMARDTFLPNFVRLHAKKFSDVKMEETLTMPILGGEHALQGTFDCAAVIDGKLTMVDYKTSAREYPQSKIHRNPQLYIYSSLYRHCYGQLPEQIMYKVFIKGEKRIQTLKLPLTEEKLDLMMKNVETICKDMLYRINTNEWYSNYNCFCGNAKTCFGS